MIILQLFYSFFVIGLVNFGGGLAIIPLLTDVITSNQWMTQEQIIDMIAISEATPGPIGVNLATYAGFQTAGIFGAITATVGIMMPSLIIVIVISHMYLKFKNSIYAKGIMEIVRPVVVGLILGVLVEIAQIALLEIPLFQETKQLFDLFDWRSILIAVAVFISYYKLKLHPVILIIASAFIGILIF